MNEARRAEMRGIDYDYDYDYEKRARGSGWELICI